MSADREKLRVSRAIIVEGRDDVAAVSAACDALIIPTHGYGIAAETWDLIAKAAEEKGLLILTDPDKAGEEIRRRLTERFPDAVQCYMTRDEAAAAGDIGIENARPEAIAAAVRSALERAGQLTETGRSKAARPVFMSDLIRLGLTGAEGAAALRAAAGRELGTGSCNARAMLTRLEGFGIGIDELEETLRSIRDRESDQND